VGTRPSGRTQRQEEEIFVKTLTRALGFRCSVARPEFGSSTCDQYEYRHWRDDGTRVPPGHAYPMSGVLEAPLATTPKQMITPRNASAGTWAHHTPLSAAKEIAGSQYPKKSENWSKTQVTRMSDQPPSTPCIRSFSHSEDSCRDRVLHRATVVIRGEI
jgi:hypothetical protein